MTLTSWPATFLLLLHEGLPHTSHLDHIMVMGLKMGGRVIVEAHGATGGRRWRVEAPNGTLGDDLVKMLRCWIYGKLRQRDLGDGLTLGMAGLGKEWTSVGVCYFVFDGFSRLDEVSLVV